MAPSPRLRDRVMRLTPLSLALVASLLLAACGAEVERTFPSDPITLIVNWPAGGGMDRAGRLLAEHVRSRLDVPIAVVNVSGAGGATGIRHVAESNPDGYTLGILGASLVASQYISPNAKSVDEIDLIAFIGSDPAALQVRADSQIDTLDEYLERARSSPGAVKNGNDAPGGVSHIAAVLLQRSANIELTLVPYGGYASTAAAIFSGEIESATLPVDQLIEQYRTGAVKILGVMSEERHFMAPDVPTFREQGVDLVTGGWRAIYLPNGVPEDRRVFLESVFLEAIRDPSFQAAAEQNSFFISPKTSAEAKRFVDDFDQALYPILLDAGLVRARHK